MILDIIHRPVIIWKYCPVYFSKHNVSETGFCLRLQVKPTQLGPINRASPYLRTPVPDARWSITSYPRCTEIGTSSIDWPQLSRFYLKTEIESSLRNGVFWKIKRTVFLDKDRTIDNMEKHNVCSCIMTGKMPFGNSTGRFRNSHLQLRYPFRGAFISCIHMNAVYFKNSGKGA
jgi:hypothetical protein